jgi:hypothetical protein
MNPGLLQGSVMATGPEGPALANSLMLQHWVREEVAVTIDLEFQTFLGEGRNGSRHRSRYGSSQGRILC